MILPKNILDKVCTSWYFMVFQLDLFRSDESSLSFVHIQLQNSKYYLRNFPHTLFARHSWNRKSRYSILHLLTQTSGCKKLSDKTGIISNFHVFVKLRHKAGKVSNKSFFSRWQEILCLTAWNERQHWTWYMVDGLFRAWRVRISPFSQVSIRRSIVSDVDTS